MNAWVAVVGVILACDTALVAGAPVAGNVPPAAGEANSPDSLADLEWVSREATCKASSSASNAGVVYSPMRALLTGEDPNVEDPRRRTVAFHTEAENQPHIIITLPQAYTVGGIFIENLRYHPTIPEYEIMFRRAANLAVWLSADGNSWEQVWRAERAEASWSIRLKEPMEARYVKIGLLNSEILHLTAVRIYGTASGLPKLTRLPGTDRILLRDGSVLRGEVRDRTYSIAGALGKAEVPSARVVGMVLEGAEANLARVVLADGQVLAGAISGPAVEIRLESNAKRIVPWREISQLGYRVSGDKPAVSPTSAPFMLLKTGDRVICAGLALRIRGRAAEAPLEAANFRWLSLDSNRPGSFRAGMWDGGSLAGELEEPTLKVTLAPDGPEAAVKVALIESITNPSPRPPAEVLRKVQGLVAALGDDSYQRREAAHAALVALGRGILPLLESYRRSDNLEVRARIEAIFQQLSK